MSEEEHAEGRSEGRSEDGDNLLESLGVTAVNASHVEQNVLTKVRESCDYRFRVAILF